jgi:hypothetical protein
MNDERLAEAIVRRDQLFGEANSLAQINGPWGLSQEHVGGPLDEITVVRIGLQNAAKLIAGLEERYANRRGYFGESMRGGQAGDATTNYGD